MATKTPSMSTAIAEATGQAPAAAPAPAPESPKVAGPIDTIRALMAEVKKIEAAALRMTPATTPLDDDDRIILGLVARITPNPLVARIVTDCLRATDVASGRPVGG